MKVKQISIFLENKKGRLLEALKVLGREKVNIRALSIADTNDFGILRLIVADPEKAKVVLEQDGFTVKESDVIAIVVTDEPGGLANVLSVLNKAEINVEYIYAFADKQEADAVVVLRTENIDEGVKTLKKAGVKMLSPKEIYNL
ncbi:MAG: ACT domain-containing protein, partial [Candidatus Firestonebacteria bacterium]